MSDDKAPHYAISHVLEEVKIRQDKTCSYGSRVNIEEEFIRTLRECR
jgi:hypothetical protein